MNVTLYAICRNEEKNIQKFLENCKYFSEVVVVDTGSTDDSVKLLRENGITVHEHPQERKDFDFSLARNTALSYVDTEWAFSLDFNETVENFSEDDIGYLAEFCTLIRHRRFDDLTDVIKESTEILPRFHRVKNYKWVNRIHEVLVFVPSEIFPHEIIEQYDVKITKKFSKSADKNLFYLSLCEQEYEKDPNNPFYIWFIVNHHHHMKDYEKVLFFGEKFINLTEAYSHPFRPLVFLHSSNAMLNLGKGDQAITLAMNGFSESQYFDKETISVTRDYIIDFCLNIGFIEMALFCTSIMPDEKTTELKKELIEKLYENID